jgi:hypothetical protein
MTTSSAGRPGLRLDVHGDAAAVVLNGHDLVGADRHADRVAVAAERLVHRVVHHLVHQVVQAALVGATDVHAWPLAHGLQALENGNVGAAIARPGLPRSLHWLSQNLNSRSSSAARLAQGAARARSPKLRR